MKINLSRKITFLLVSLLILLSPALNASVAEAGQTESPGSAAESEKIPEAVESAASGIVRVETACLNGSHILETRKRTGFLVGVDGGTQVVLTTAEDLTFSEKDLAGIAKKAGLDDTIQLTQRLTVSFQGDTVIETEVASFSEQRDLAILNLRSSLTDKFDLTFAAVEPEEGDEVYLLSFPLNDNEEYAVYSAESASIEKGTYKGLGEDQDTHTKYRVHTVIEDEGAYGAPLVNESGHVVGMNVLTEKDKALSLTLEELTSFLDLHEIGYAVYAKDTVGRSNWVYVFGVLAAMALIFMVWQLIRLRSVNNEEPVNDKPENPGESLKEKRKETVPGIVEDRAFLIESRTQRQITLIDRTQTIGSSQEKADIVVAGNRKVSRVHARIEKRGTDWYVTDLGSTNGTRLNGSKLTPMQSVKLKDKDRIDLSDEGFVFCKR